MLRAARARCTSRRRWPVSTGTRGRIRPVRVSAFNEPPSGPAERRRLVECDYFTLDYLHGGEPVACGGGRLQLLTVVRGQGRLISNGDAEGLTPGQTWLLPA